MKKKCSKCGLHKALCEFHKQKLSKDGLQAYCKSCDNNYQQSYHQDNRMKINARQRAYKELHRVELAEWRRNYVKTLSGYLHQCYDGIKQRCSNPRCTAFRYYGHRGIENKFSSFEEFYNYVTQDLRYDNISKLEGLWIDRTDNSSDYKKGNIRFVTAAVSANNRRKGKYPDRKGEAAWAAKLTEKDIRKIRLLYDTSPIFQYQLASQFCISQSCVRDIVNRNTWKHI